MQARYSPPGAAASRPGRPPHAVGRRKPTSSALLKDGEDVAGRVLEPGYVGAAACRCAAGDASCIRQLAVMLELNAGGGQSIHGLVDVVDREVEDRVRRGHVVGFGVDEGGVSARDLQSQALRTLFNVEPEGLAVELLRGRQIVDGKTAECLRVSEHAHAPLIW